MPEPATPQLLLAPDAETAWQLAARPWLERGRGSLSRRLVVVPTRGQALVWKQRCVRARLPLLGVEFITPGLARRKWLPLLAPERPVLGKEFLLLGLRGIIAARLEDGRAAGADDDALAVWRSLRSDPERALQALDDLAQAGFDPAAAAPRRELAILGAELRRWTEALGHAHGPAQAIAAATEPLPPGTAPLADDVLVLGLGPENANEFFNVAALLRRAARATVVLPAPALRGAAEADSAGEITERPDEAWVTRWEKFLGVPALPLAPDAEPAPLAPDATIEPELLLAAHRRAEAELIVDRVRRWIAEDAADEDDIAVVFPGPGPLHRLVSARLRALGLPHHDLVGRVAAPPVDTQLLRGVIAFWAKGGRLDEVLALWPRLHALNLAELSADYGAFRREIDERFHTTCDHSLAAAVALDTPPPAAAAPATATERDPDAPLSAREKRSAASADLHRLASALLPAWEPRLSLADAASRLRAVATAWGLTLPEGFATLDAFAKKDSTLWPRDALAETLLAFLPETVPAEEPAPHAGRFARLVLTTRRRAEGAPWGRVLLAQANAGEWPRRRDPNPWLDDAARLALNRGGRGAAPLLTSEDAAALERAGYAALAASVRRPGGLAYSASAADEADPDRPLAPNSVLERLLWARGERRPQEALARLARELPAPAPSAPAPAPALDAWRAVRAARRDPEKPFDENFLCIDLTTTADSADSTAAATAPLPASLSPSTLEKAVADPAVLWFRGLLRIEPARREPLERALALRRGQIAHRLLADAVRPPGARDGEWGPLKLEVQARALLEDGLARERAAFPAGQWYWEAEQGRLEALARALLRRFYATGEGDYVCVECWLPEKARLTLPGWEIPVRGRIDVARSNRPHWDDAIVHVYDYKSGAAEKALDAQKMAERAESLQLALYLDAVRSLGVARATIWKLTADEASPLDSTELDQALAALPRLMEAMRAGRYGALTPDRNPHGGREPWTWPLACTPIPARDLKAKYARTFAGAADADPTSEEGNDD